MAPQRDTGTDAEAELPRYAGHYRLEERLGSGGMGVVHLARSGSGLRLAVKVVHAEFAKDPEFRGRFRQEIAAARRVSGAFTAPVVDADADGERPWMATLYIPGPTLAEHVKRNGPMPPGQLRRLMAGLAEALRDIHRVGVVHRDLKPSNVLLAEDGPKVIDFGISRPSDSELRTETGKLIGTPPFMAPEQFRRPRQVGPAADIFALGSVMVHAATGRGPFDSDSPYIVAYQVVHDEADLTGVPENLAPLVTRCLAKEPEDRPTPDELMRELRSVAASYDTQAFIPAQRDVLSGDGGGSGGDGGGSGGGNGSGGKKGSGGAGSGGTGGREASTHVREAGGQRRVRKPLVAAGGVLALVVAGALVSSQWLAAPSPASPKDSGQRSAPAAVAQAHAAWDTKPGAGADGVDGADGLPQCAHGAGKLFCAQRGLLSALDPSDGKVLWRHAFDEVQDTVPRPVVSGGLVHVVTRSGRRLEAFAPETGKRRWSLGLAPYGTLEHAGGTVLLTSADGTATGVDGATGKIRWTRRLTGYTTPVFAAFPGGGPAYATTTSSDGSTTRITAVDPETGDVRWDTELDGTLAPVGTLGDELVLTGTDKYDQTDVVVRYDPAAEKARRVKLPVALPQAQATVLKDTVYLLAAGGGMVAVDLDALKQRWRLETSVSLGSMPAADSRHVYFSSPDGRLLAVDARTGKLLGQTGVRMSAQSDRVVADLPTPSVGDGRVYGSAPDGTVFAVGADDPEGWRGTL
ncbi:serine/threonine-protein kinase [Streptomyces sp. NPDC059786]|uniref:serine/threonine-protein kinase n=1 Tax=Streptomyces sp. NPDC059786 TaxID=3346946 RepID=UPI00365800FE